MHNTIQIEHTNVIPTFDFQVENSGRTVQDNLNAMSLRLFGLHSDVNDAHRAGANRLQNKCIPPNTTHSDPNAMLYVFEDNEAVIKMISTGRSPTMRHVSRTHRVALDWFDRINLDCK